MQGPNQEKKTFKPKILQHNQTAFLGSQPKLISEQANTNQVSEPYVPRPHDLRGLSDLSNVNSFTYGCLNGSLPQKAGRSDSFNLLRDSTTLLNSNGLNTTSSFHSNESPFCDKFQNMFDLTDLNTDLKEFDDFYNNNESQYNQIERPQNPFEKNF